MLRERRLAIKKDSRGLEANLCGVVSVKGLGRTPGQCSLSAATPPDPTRPLTTYLLAPLP